jgi:hypothetical protein
LPSPLQEPSNQIVVEVVDDLGLTNLINHSRVVGPSAFFSSNSSHSTYLDRELNNIGGSYQSRVLFAEKLIEVGAKVVIFWEYSIGDDGSTNSRLVDRFTASVKTPFQKKDAVLGNPVYDFLGAYEPRYNKSGWINSSQILFAGSDFSAFAVNFSLRDIPIGVYLVSTMGPSYGKYAIHLNGKFFAAIDFYSPNIKSLTLPLPVQLVRRGVNRLDFILLKSQSASAGTLIGLSGVEVLYPVPPSSLQEALLNN